MGKLALILVAGAVLGGSALTLSTRRVAGETTRVESEAQADQLAREIAESARSLALTRMMGPSGFVDPAMGTQPYDGGQYEISVVPAADGQTADVTVRGSYGGAVHTLRGRYRFVPLSFPSALWLDVPYATSQLAGGTPTISGGPQNLPVRLDPRRHASLGLATVLPLSGLTSDFTPDMTAAGSAFQIPSAGSWPGLLSGLHVNDAEDLYQVALAAMGPTDRALAGPLTVSSALSAPGARTITRVAGPLTVATGGTVTGEGVLLVEGGLTVQAGGRLDWTGLVIVRSLDESLPVHLVGDVSVTGGLVVAQEAFPPGGHLDVTVWRSATGLSSPPGDTDGPWAGPGLGPYPWYNHTHRWEGEVPEGRVLYFADGTADRHEALLHFRQSLAAAGSADVVLEFRNEGMHGHGQYRLTLDGVADPVAGTVRNGFPASFRSGGSAFRSAPFRASALRTFSLEVRSLRALRQRFDGSGCLSWPYCIGQDWGRGGALRVRLLRASNGAVLYEGALYWHMREDEVAAHQAAEQAWRDAVASGSGFGTHLQMGSGTTLTYAVAPLRALAGRLGFDDNTLEVLNSTSSHTTARDARAALGG